MGSRKGDIMFPIRTNLITKNRSYRAFNPTGIVLHETATPGDTDEAERNAFNSRQVNASAHAFIDWDSITQCVPWHEKAWHACEPANSRYIGIELCHTSDPAKFSIIYQQAVELFAYLFVNVIGITQITGPTYSGGKIVKAGNLMSHHEVSLTWHKTDHTDPTAYFNNFGKTVDQFRADVQNEINEKTLYGPEFTSALTKFVKDGIINSPDYWRERAIPGGKVQGDYMATFLERSTKTNSLEAAVDFCVAHQLMADKGDYWRQNCIAGKFVEGEYVRSMFIRLAPLAP